MAQCGGSRFVVALALVVTTAACMAVPDRAPQRSVAERPGKFTAAGRLKIYAPAEVDTRNDGSCVATGKLSRYRAGASLVVVRNPDGRKVAEAKLGPGVPDARTEQGRQILVPGTCQFPFEIKGLTKKSGVFTAEVEGVLKRSFFTTGSPFVTFVIEE